jgi:large subunit ribosomal protein L4
MATARKFGTDGKDLGTIDLPAAIFDGEVNEHLIWEAVNIYLQNQRQGTASAKNRAAVSGGGRKPWKQKGTGRARAGSNTSPLWPGGGAAFGPKPRDYSVRMNQKAKKNALIGALTVRAREGGIFLVEPPALDAPKTKLVSDYLVKIGLRGRRVLWVFDRAAELMLKSSRNLARVATTESRLLHPYSLMKCDCLVFTEGGLKSLSERLGGGDEGEAEAARPRPAAKVKKAPAKAGRAARAKARAKEESA